jgi:hypothetical protein
MVCTSSVFVFSVRGGTALNGATLSDPAAAALQGHEQPGLSGEFDILCLRRPTSEVLFLNNNQDSRRKT